MGGKNTYGKHAVIEGKERTRFLLGTNTPVIRIMDGKRRFFWGVKEDGGGYRRVVPKEFELR